MNPTPQPDQPPQDVGGICHTWWKIYLNRDTGVGRADRAKLRRAGTPVDILSIAAVHDLYAALERKITPERLALIAVALARVESDDEPAAIRFGRKTTNDNRVLSQLRFQNLIRITDPDVLIVPLCRALMIIDKKADVRRLARDLYFWGEKVRTQWCFDYYGAPAASPEHSQNEES